MATLCAHPNIDVRVFNPFRFRARWARLPQYLLDFDRMVRRMHNKIFIVDNAVSIIGMIVMIGIADNDAVVKLDAIRRFRAMGHSIDDAVLLGGRQRLRAIAMTSLTTITGVLPLVFGWGSGGELYQRDDDSEATVRHRLRVYERQTAPLLDYYRDRDLLAPIRVPVDVVCANLPYLREDEIAHLAGERTSLAFEPREAVVAGAESAGSPVVLQVSENAVKFRYGRLLPLARAAVAAGARHVGRVAGLAEAVEVDGDAVQVVGLACRAVGIDRTGRATTGARAGAQVPGVRAAAAQGALALALTLALLLGGLCHGVRDAVAGQHSGDQELLAFEQHPIPLAIRTGC